MRCTRSCRPAGARAWCVPAARVDVRVKVRQIATPAATDRAQSCPGPLVRRVCSAGRPAGGSCLPARRRGPSAGASARTQRRSRARQRAPPRALGFSWHRPGAHLRLHQLARRPRVLGEHHQRGRLARAGPGVTGAPAASLGPGLPYPEHDLACALALCAARPAALCACQAECRAACSRTACVSAGQSARGKSVCLRLAFVAAI